MKIALGTVQWGMNYGISNSNGVPTDNELHRIFTRMREVRIDTLDTAISYGNAEKRLGDFVSTSHKIISKANALDSHRTIKEQCLESLENTRQLKLEGYLLHNAKPLLENNLLWDELRELVKMGLVEKIGFSVYDPLDLEKILNKGIIPDIVQLPFNILDRRFLPFFDKLNALGSEIHVRSVFLQGLLIKAFHDSPEDFKRWETHWKIYRAWINENKMSPIEACIRHVLSYDSIDKIIIGVTNLQELNEIISAQNRNPVNAPLELSIVNEELINPLEWPITKQLLSNKR